ncbi:transporter substrate-binding domain-containing protein [Megalodesulfovibrio paquesii]
MLVGVVEAPPFAYQDEEGAWTGIAVVLWRTIMEHRNQTCTFIPMDLPGLLQALETGSIDAGVSALSITSSREQHMDFSYPYYDTDLAVAVPHQASAGVFLNVVEEIFSLDFLAYVSAMLFLALLAGLVVWLLERKANPEQFRQGLTGVIDGVWWASVTMTTVGYGDTAPKSTPARVVALLWMFTCVILVAVFTASITTTLTMHRIGGRISSAGDLRTARTGCLVDSQAEEYLQHIRATPRRYETLDAALDDLTAGRLDAVLHDRPLLQYAMLRGTAKGITLLSMMVDQEDYGFAFPAHSPWRKRVNIALLRLRADRAYWEHLTETFLGS